jgi:hypothetical protein
MDKFLDTYDHLKLNEENINHLNRFTASNEIEAAKKSPGPEKFIAEFYHTFKEKLIPTLLNFSTKEKGKEYHQTHSMNPVLHSFQNWTKTQKKRITNQSL